MSVLKIQIKRPIILKVIKVWPIQKTNLFFLGFQPTNEHTVILLITFVIKKKKKVLTSEEDSWKIIKPHPQNHHKIGLKTCIEKIKKACESSCMIAGRSCYFTIEIFNINAKDKHPCAPGWLRRIHRLQFQEMQQLQYYYKETPVLSHLPFTSFGLYRLTEQIHLIMLQESSPENMHRESTENCWVTSCTGSGKFNEQLSHCKRETEPWSWKETGWEDQDILLSSAANHQISHLLEKTLSVLKT